MKKSVSQRIRMLKSGKARRRATTLGHSRSNKTSLQMRRKEHSRGLKGVERTYLTQNLSG